MKRRSAIVASLLMATFGLAVLYRVVLFRGYVWPVNYDAPYHVLLTLRAYAAVPFLEHYFVPLVTLGAPMDKAIPWGATLPGIGGNYFYLSFPSLGFVFPYFLLWLFGVYPTLSSLMWLNFAIHAFSVILMVKLATLIARRSGASADRTSWIALLAGCSYIFAKELMMTHGPVYWHHSLYQPVFLAQILLFVTTVYNKDTTSKAVAAGFLLVSFLGPSIEWTGYVTNAGLFLALIFLYFAQRCRLHLWLAIGVVLVTAAALLVFVLQTMLAVDFDTVVAYLEQRRSARSASHRPMWNWLALAFDSFGGLLLIGVAALIWKGSLIFRQKQSPNRIEALVTIFVVSFPLLENFLMAGHAQDYHFDRAKIAVPLIVGLAMLCAEVSKPSRLYAIYGFWACAILSNLVPAGLSGRLIQVKGGADVMEEFWGHLQQYNQPCALITTSRVVRGFENTVTGRSIVENVPDEQKMQTLTRERNACLGVWLTSSPTPIGWWNKAYVYDPVLNHFVVVTFDGIAVLRTQYSLSGDKADSGSD
jgi:hypothetical protein